MLRTKVASALEGSKKRTPKNFAIANFGHPVFKCWLRSWCDGCTTGDSGIDDDSFDYDNEGGNDEDSENRNYDFAFYMLYIPPKIVKFYHSL